MTLFKNREKKITQRNIRIPKWNKIYFSDQFFIEMHDTSLYVKWLTSHTQEKKDLNEMFGFKNKLQIINKHNAILIANATTFYHTK